MQWLQCGCSLSNNDVTPQGYGHYETFTPRHFLDQRQEVAVEHHDSNQIQHDKGVSTPIWMTQSEGSITPFRKSKSLRNYDSMNARCKSNKRPGFPASWVTRRQYQPHGRATVTSYPTSPDPTQELPIPEQHHGMYESFCQPQNWSPAFASPGDFTIRADRNEANTHRTSGIIYRIAVVCCSIYATTNQSSSLQCHINQATRRKSYVQYVERTENELLSFAEAMALRYLGHRLIEKLPKAFSVLPGQTSADFDKHHTAVIEFLTYVLSITHVGYNLLVKLDQKLTKDWKVRRFFGLPPLTSSRKRISRSLVVPYHMSNVWMDGIPNQLTAIRQPLQQHAMASSSNLESRNELLMSCNNRRSRRLSESDQTAIRPHHSYATFQKSRAHLRVTHPATLTSDCTRFTVPSQWSLTKQTDIHSFTVEITAITIRDGHANYTISILVPSHKNGVPQVFTEVERRYSEFDALVQRIETNVRTFTIRPTLPSKTLFRYLSIQYLERRAEALQIFLERLLQWNFVGILNQSLSMVAEPNVRNFLQLPRVEWSVVPGNPQTQACRRRRRSLSDAQKECSLYTLSPPSDLTPYLTSSRSHVSSSSDMYRDLEMSSSRSTQSVSFPPRRSELRRRSDSM